MVFQSVVWMEIFFKINSAFVKIQDLQICWFTGTQITLPEGKYGTNFNILFLIACIRNEKFVFYIFFCLFCSYFHFFCEVNEKQCHWISFIKSRKNDFIESWRFNWRTGHDQFTKLFFESIQTEKVWTWNYIVDIRKTAAEECQQGKRRWKFICCELKTLEYNFWIRWFDGTKMI